MVLNVPFDEFAAAVKRHIPKHEAYVEKRGHHLRLTAGAPGILVVTVADMPRKSVEAALEKDGVKVLSGAWMLSEPIDADPEPADAVYFVAIAYNSRETRPGLWIDAYPYEPTSVEALRGMYDEFRANGEMGDFAFEDFINACNANVVVGSPAEITEWVRRNRPELES